LYTGIWAGHPRSQRLSLQGKAKSSGVGDVTGHNLSRRSNRNLELSNQQRVQGVGPDEAGRGVSRMQRSANAGQHWSPASLPAALLAPGVSRAIATANLPFLPRVSQDPWWRANISLECICRVAACTLMQGPRKHNNPSKLSKPAHWVPLI
jgi:hypothetical protein